MSQENNPAPAAEDRNAPLPLAGFITGPTAVGKTEIGIILAERFGWSILSVDSRQIYRRLEAGTAKPSAAELARAPHLLLDLLEPGESCSAGTYLRLAREALDRLAGAGGTALAVGGAGLYWEALTRGLHALPPASPEIRARHKAILAEEGMAGLYRRLREADPERAAELSPNDRQRIGRALEVLELTGRPMSRLLAEEERQSATAAPPPAVALLRTREDLRERIERRCARMLESGLVEELRGLLEAGVPPDAPGLRTVGYREFLPHVLQGEPLDACRERFLRNSRQYARRQETWLRHRLPGCREVLIPAGETPGETAARILELGCLRATASR